MSVLPTAPIEITAFDWVPDFARGFVRDLRPRWACEEAGLDYRERLIPVLERPGWYYSEQPFGQVPALKDGDLRLFESGAILLYLGEKDDRLLPKAGQTRADTVCWLFAALSSIEPYTLEVLLLKFSIEEEWAKLRRPSLAAFVESRLERLADALGGKDYLTGRFSVADIAMATVLREAQHTGLLSMPSSLCDYVERCLARPAFTRALAAQLAAFGRTEKERGKS
ncbi:MAG: glutathione S-transferase [Alphaproteobacteria bacterium RIFCSPHIGHO2_12_FULL_63_12]|nr:MAG: glutathione S-transferase [Alphaproteobacteria bacterium RIFCSPHIGHO2_12_FULL_63_12]